MSQRTVVLDLASNHQLARDLVAGGVFVPDVLRLGDDVTLLLQSGDTMAEVPARVVFVDATKGSGLQLVGCDTDMKQRIIALASGMAGPATVAFDDVDDPPPEPAPEDDAPEVTEPLTPEELAENALPSDDGDDEDDPDRKLALNVHERLRNLTVVQQLRIAQKGEVSERIVLERIYGKTVWEALLRNPRITGPEVARIARMGALPRTQMEVIVGNGAWLQIPEVRRALLSNPRLGTDQILRVLRLLPKHELKLASMQTAYPVAVRDAAKRMLRELGG